MRTMIHVIFNDCKRAFISWRFIIAVLLIGVGVYICSMQFGGSSIESLLSNSTGHEDWAALSIIAVTLPFSGAFFEDWNSGNLKLQVIRQKKEVYIFSKFFVCAFSGGMVAVLGRSLLMFIGFINGKSFSMQDYLPDSSVFWRDYFFENNYMFTFWLMIFFSCFLAGSIYAVIGLIISAFITNPFVAYFVPYIFFMIELLLPEKLGHVIISYIEAGYSVYGTVIDNILYDCGVVFIYMAVLLEVYSYGVKRRLNS